MLDTHQPYRIALVCGEPSGDTLGAALITQLKQRYPHAVFEGVTGPQMREAGCQTLADCHELSLMGIAEIVRHLPRLFALRKRLVQHWTQHKPDIFIGIDAPDFNLGLEKKLKSQGITTVHYVSPTVWAWRSGRVKTIRQAVNHVLCIFPFEPNWYAPHGVAATFVGHPLAHQIRPFNKTDACTTLDLDSNVARIALLPGSRGSEVRMLAPVMLTTAQQLQGQNPRLQFIVPFANEKVAAIFNEALCHYPALKIHTVMGQAHDAITASDAVLACSGTVTLECLLLQRPMVVTFKTSGFNVFLLRTLGMLKTQFVSMPNILAGREIVPEILQEAATPQNLSAAVLRLLETEAGQQQIAAFTAIADELRAPPAEAAAQVVSTLL